VRKHATLPSVGGIACARFDAEKSAAALVLYFTLQKQRLYHRERIGASWMWALAFGHHEDRAPTHGYEAILLRSRALG
jgi:hypothetical protein